MYRTSLRYGKINNVVALIRNPMINKYFPPKESTIFPTGINIKTATVPPLASSMLYHQLDKCKTLFAYKVRIGINKPNAKVCANMPGNKEATDCISRFNV